MNTADMIKQLKSKIESKYGFKVYRAYVAKVKRDFGLSYLYTSTNINVFIILNYGYKMFKRIELIVFLSHLD